MVIIHLFHTFHRGSSRGGIGAIDDRIKGKHHIIGGHCFPVMELNTIAQSENNIPSVLIVLPFLSQFRRKGTIAVALQKPVEYLIRYQVHC